MAACTLTGPGAATVNQPSSPFTVALGEGDLTGNLQVTPTDNGAGGAFTPAGLTLTGTTRSATFTYTASAAGTVQISTYHNRQVPPTDPITVTVSAESGSNPGTVIAIHDFHTPGWTTFGQIIPRGIALTRLKVGNLITQMDVKVTWPDGSIRYAILTAHIPAPGPYPVTGA
jgi:hypothetical protein